MMPNFLPRYEHTGGWVAQRKFNGQHGVGFIPANRKNLFLYGRDQQPLNVNITRNLLSQFTSLALEPGKDYWLNFEYMDRQTKTPCYKGKFVLFDVLQAGRYLFGIPDLMGRLRILNHICGEPTVLEPNNGLALRVTQDIWMAETFENKFIEHFVELIHLPEVEGLVLKRRRWGIEDTGAGYWESENLIRCRREDKVKDC
jgi:hypothetical protein